MKITDNNLTEVFFTAVNKESLAPGRYIFVATPIDGLPVGVGLNDLCQYTGTVWQLLLKYITVPPTMQGGTPLKVFTKKDNTWFSLENTSQSPSIIEADSLIQFPETGSSNVIYVAKDTNKIYRNESTELVLPEIPQDSVIAITTSITSSDNLQTVINNAQNGDAIFLANGTYLINQSLLVNKEIALVGETQAGVIIQDSRTNSQSFINITANNVILKNLITLHSTTDSAIGTAITVSGAGFPQPRLNNVRLYNVKTQYSKAGLAVRCDNFIVKDCTFEVVAGSSTRRGILHYGNGGDSFIKNCHFINSTTGALRAICPTSTTGSNPNEVQAGTLTVENSTFTGNLSQFFNIDNHQGTPESFELIIKNNTTPETNAFIASFGGANNFGNIFKRVVLIGNTLTNSHSSGLGKGVFAIDGTGSITFRSSVLPVVAFGNTLGQLNFRAGYAEASGSSGSIVGYSTTPIILPIVEITTGSSSTYIELAPKDTIDQLYQTTSAPLASAIANSVTTVSNIKVRYNANGTGGNLDIACVSGNLTCQLITARQIFNGGLTTNAYTPNQLLTTTFATFSNGELDGPAELLDYEIFVSNSELYEVKLRLTGSSGTDLVLINLKRVY
jgi:hypothetical protein